MLDLLWILSWIVIFSLDMCCSLKLMAICLLITFKVIPQTEAILLNLRHLYSNFYLTFPLNHPKHIVHKVEALTLFSSKPVTHFVNSISSVQFSSFQSLGCVWLFVTPWIAARQASRSIINSWSSLKLTFIELVMPSCYLIICHPLLLLPPIPPSISLFQWVNSLHQVEKVLEFQL